MGTGSDVAELLAQRRGLIERVANAFIRRHGWIEFDDAVQIVSIEAWRILQTPCKWHSVDAAIAHLGALRLLDELRSGRVTGVTRTGRTRDWRKPLSLNVEVGTSDDEPLEWLVMLPDEETGYEAVDHADELDFVMAALPDRERCVVYLHFFEGLTQIEVGELLGVSESRVCQLVRRARERMISRLAA